LSFIGRSCFSLTPLCRCVNTHARLTAPWLQPYDLATCKFEIAPKKPEKDRGRRSIGGCMTKNASDPARNRSVACGFFWTDARGTDRVAVSFSQSQSQKGCTAPSNHSDPTKKDREVSVESYAAKHYQTASKSRSSSNRSSTTCPHTLPIFLCTRLQRLGTSDNVFSQAPHPTLTHHRSAAGLFSASSPRAD